MLGNPLTYVDPSGFGPESADSGATPGDTDGAMSVFAETIYVNAGAPPPNRPEQQDEFPQREASDLRIGVAPVDVGGTGDTPSFAADVSSWAAEHETLVHILSFGLGAKRALDELMVSVAKNTVLNALTFGGYGTYEYGKAIWDGYDEDGFLGELNAITPLYQIAKAAADTHLAIDREDYEAGGAASVKTGTLVASAALTVVGGVAAAAEKAAAARASTATTPKGGTYLLRDEVTGQVMRTGRTGDLVRRAAEHGRAPALRGFKFGLFFGPRRQNLAPLEQLESLDPHDAIAVVRVGDLGIIDGTWPIIGRASGWNRASWLIPKFIRKSDLSRRAWAVTYSDDDPNMVISESPIPYDTSDLLRDGVRGSGSAER